MIKLDRLADLIESDLRARVGKSSIVILGSYQDFKASIRDSSGEQFKESEYKKAYDIAKKALKELERNYSRRDPIASKLYRNFLDDNDGYYLIGNEEYASRVVRTKVKEFLNNTTRVKSLGKVSDSVIHDIQSSFLSTADIEPKGLNQIKNLSIKAQTILSDSGLDLKIKAILDLYNDNPDVVNSFIARFESEVGSILDESKLGEAALDKFYDDLRGKKTTKTGRNITKTSKTRRQGTPKISNRRNTTYYARKTSGNISMTALVNALNRKLPQTIKSNMGTPKLNWRTGRFANSVRVLSITDKNVIKYTYMLRPYAVFEMSDLGNAKWATPARDPRGLIGISIRQIAASITNEKFTTRRER